MNLSSSSLKTLCPFTMVVLLCTGAAYPAPVSRTLEIYRGMTPTIDGVILPGEYDDAVIFYGVKSWQAQFNPVMDDNDLSLKGWAKHDGNSIYFAFQITDDVLYGIDINRWLPDECSCAHELSPKGLPWFGDGIELMIQADIDANVYEGQYNFGDGRSWQMVCNLTKSRLGGVGKGGLLEGEERIKPRTWNNYQAWIINGNMQAAVAPKRGGKGYVLEWMVCPEPCLEVSKGKFWTPDIGIVTMGFNIAVQDLDQRERGKGNWGNFSHEQWWAGEKNRQTEMKQWGTLVIHPGLMPVENYSR